MRFQQIREEVLARSKAEIEAAAEADFKAEMERIRQEARSTAARRSGVPLAPAAAAPAPKPAAAAAAPAAAASLAETTATATVTAKAALNSNVFHRGRAVAASRAAKAAAAAPAAAPAAAAAAAGQQQFRFQAFPPSREAQPSSFLDVSAGATQEAAAAAAAAREAAAEHDAFAADLAAAEEALAATHAAAPAPAASSLLEAEAESEADSEDALDHELAAASEDAFFTSWIEEDAADTAQEALDAADDAFGGSLIETAAAAKPAPAPAAAAAAAARPNGYGLLEVASSAAAAAARRDRSHDDRSDRRAAAAKADVRDVHRGHAELPPLPYTAYAPPAAQQRRQSREALNSRAAGAARAPAPRRRRSPSPSRPRRSRSSSSSHSSRRSSSSSGSGRAGEESADAAAGPRSSRDQRSRLASHSKKPSPSPQFQTGTDADYAVKLPAVTLPPLPYHAPPAAQRAIKRAAADARAARRKARRLARLRDRFTLKPLVTPERGFSAVEAASDSDSETDTDADTDAEADAEADTDDEVSFLEILPEPYDVDSAGVMAPVQGFPSPAWPYAPPVADRTYSYSVSHKVRWGADFGGSRGYDVTVRPGSLEERATGPLGGGLPRESLFEAASGAVADSDALVVPTAGPDGQASPLQQPNHFTINGVQLSVGSREPITVPIFPAVPPPPLAPVDRPAEADTIAAAGTPEQYLVQQGAPASVGEAAAILGRLPFSGAGGLSMLSPTGVIGPARSESAAYYPYRPGSPEEQRFAQGAALSGAAVPTPLGMPGVAAMAALGGGPGAGAGGVGAQAGLAAQAQQLPAWLSGGYGGGGPNGGGPSGGPYGANTYTDPVRTPLAALISQGGPVAAAAEAWSGVQTDATLREVQYPADTPFMPTDGIGPKPYDPSLPSVPGRTWSLPPAPIEQPTAATPDYQNMAAMGLPMGGILG